MKKRIISIILTACISLTCLSTQAFAVPSVTGTYAGISTYNYCSYGGRTGAEYVQGLKNGLNALATAGYINYSTISGGMFLNDSVTNLTVTGTGKATIYAYAGHGLNYDSTNNSLHLNAQSGTHQTYHSYLPNQEKSTYVNVKTSDLKFNHKYVILYTCNQLTNSGNTTKSQNIIKMLNGTRLLMGFASVMYLDYREATYFTNKLSSNTIKDAFIAAADVYQKQRDSGDSIVRIIGYNSAANDRITTTYSFAPAASSSMSSFGIIATHTVTHTGITI